MKPVAMPSGSDVARSCFGCTVEELDHECRCELGGRLSAMAGSLLILTGLGMTLMPCVVIVCLPVLSNSVLDLKLER
jgi:hypothetical protein